MTVNEVNFDSENLKGSWWGKMHEEIHRKRAEPQVKQNTEIIEKVDESPEDERYF